MEQLGKIYFFCGVKCFPKRNLINPHIFFHLRGSLLPLNLVSVACPIWPIRSCVNIWMTVSPGKYITSRPHTNWRRIRCWFGYLGRSSVIMRLSQKIFTRESSHNAAKWVKDLHCVWDFLYQHQRIVISHWPKQFSARFLVSDEVSLSNVFNSDGATEPQLM